MRITQGAFSFLPDLTDVQITAQLQYCIDQGWAVGIEFTDDPHPRNTYWDLWGLPAFDVADAAGIMVEVKACREAHPQTYIRINAFDSSHGWETVRLSFIAHRPSHEPGFRLQRTEGPGRHIVYTTHAYATDRPAGDRYG